MKNNFLFEARLLSDPTLTINEVLAHFKRSFDVANEVYRLAQITKNQRIITAAIDALRDAEDNYSWAQEEVFREKCGDCSD